MKRPSIEVGIISAAHGIRGEVKIKSFTIPPARIFSYGPLSNADGKIFTFTPRGGSDQALIARIHGISDRNEAEKLKGTVLFAKADQLPDDASEKLIGLEVKLKDGTPYGHVTTVQNFGAGDIIEIEKADGKSEMLPLNDAFIQVLDTHIIVTPPDYLEADRS